MFEATNVRNIEGWYFGSLKVLFCVGSDKRRTFWLCECMCGKFKVVRRDSLVSGDVKSCGCAKSWAQIGKSRSKIKAEDIIEAIRLSKSFREVSRRVGLSEGGSNYIIKKYIEQYNLDTSHMTGQGWNKGDASGSLKRLHDRNRIPLDNILVENSTYPSHSTLRLRLIREGRKEYKCESCGNSEWMGRPISLELHHANGIKIDNRIENLKILCPNCHAQTETYRGKNINNHTK